MGRPDRDEVREREQARGARPIRSASPIAERTGFARAAVGTVAATVTTACAIAFFARAVPSSVFAGWICLVPWLLVLERTASVRAALTAGTLMSAGFVAAVFPWFPQTIANYTGVSWPTGAVVVLLLAPLLEPQFVTFAIARHLSRRVPDGPYRWLTALVGGGVYVGTEWVWPKLFADTLGHGLHASALLRQAADLFGAHGLTFVLIAANECVLVLVHDLFAHRSSVPEQRSPTAQRAAAKRPLAAASCFVLLVGGLAIYGSIRIAQLRAGDGRRPVTVAMVQANLSRYDELKAELGTFDALHHILETHFSLSQEALRQARPDFLVWPETMYPTTFGTPKSEEGAVFDRTIAAFVNDVRVPLVFGSYDARGPDEFNAAILLEPASGGTAEFDVYRKKRLFPFTEYLPWPFDSDRVRRWLPWAGTWKPGDGAAVLSLPLRDAAVRIAPLICYDAIDPGVAVAAVRQGAELLVTLSNDSWFAHAGVRRLILLVSAFRSIETRRPQLRSTPTGVSAVIDETGALVETIGVDERGVLFGSVRPTQHHWTLFLAWGNWFPPTALAAAFLLLFAAFRRTSRTGAP